MIYNFVHLIISKIKTPEKLIRDIIEKNMNIYIDMKIHEIKSNISYIDKADYFKECLYFLYSIRALNAFF